MTASISWVFGWHAQRLAIGVVFFAVAITVLWFARRGRS